MILVILLALLASFLFCGLYLLLAHRWQILDTPNARSSHLRPTPHGGGVPLLAGFVLAVLVAGLTLGPWPREYIALVVLALLFMLLGVADDLWALSSRLRFSAYGLGCLTLALYVQPQAMDDKLWLAGAVLLLVGLAMLWLVNLYNFMDGIDGIAASQCILACGAAAWLSWRGGEQAAAYHYPLFCLLLAAAHLGFLLWNWPPARLFMGDAGSIPTGFLLAGLVLLGAVQGQLELGCWLVLLALFITDASWTLLWRVFTGQAYTQAHRLHAYQRLSRHWNSHRRVDLLLIGVFCLWLLPLAWMVEIYPKSAFLLVILAYLPLLLGMAKARSFA